MININKVLKRIKTTISDLKEENKELKDVIDTKVTKINSLKVEIVNLKSYIRGLEQTNSNKNIDEMRCNTTSADDNSIKPVGTNIENIEYNYGEDGKVVKLHQGRINA